MFEDKESSDLCEMEFESMKVIDIKKRLKALGLPVTGNKSELLERLQVAMISGKETDDIDDGSGAILDLSEESPTVLDLSDGIRIASANDEILEDSLMASPVKDKDLDQTVSSIPAPVPLKKRAVLTTEDIKPKKKMVLNRNNFPTPSFIPTAEVEINANLDIDNSKEQSGEITEMPVKSGSVNKIYFASETKKAVSESEKVMMRAKRFNLIPQAVKPRLTLDPAKREQIIEWKSKVAAATPLTTAPNLDVLKKRAERFGENVSSVLKQYEDEEKINKRKSKFGQSLAGVTITDSEEQEKKKKRAERFGRLEPNVL